MRQALSLIGGLAQLARASALHAEGHRFDSDILHYQKLNAECIKQKATAKPVLKI